MENRFSLWLVKSLVNTTVQTTMTAPLINRKSQDVTTSLNWQQKILLVSMNVIDKRFVHSPFRFHLPFPNAFCVHFTRWIHEINLKDVGKLPSGMSGYIEPGGGHKLQTVPQI